MRITLGNATLGDRESLLESSLALGKANNCSSGLGSVWLGKAWLSKGRCRWTRVPDQICVCLLALF